MVATELHQTIPHDIESLIVTMAMCSYHNNSSDLHIAHRLAIILLRGDENRFYSPKISAALNCMQYCYDYNIKLTINEMSEYSDIIECLELHDVECYKIDFLKLIESIDEHIPKNNLKKYFSYWIGKKDGNLSLDVEVDAKVCRESTLPASFRASYRVIDKFDIIEFSRKLHEVSLNFDCFEYWQERESHIHKYCFSWEH